MTAPDVKSPSKLARNLRRTTTSFQCSTPARLSSTRPRAAALPTTSRPRRLPTARPRPSLPPTRRARPVLRGVSWRSARSISRPRLRSSRRTASSRALQHEGHLGAPDDASVASAATTAQALPRPPHLDGGGFVIDNSPQRGTGSDSVARAEAGIAQLAKKLSTVRNGEYLRSLLTGSTSRLLSSARPAAVAKSIEFIAQKVSSEMDTPCCAADGMPLCGWPVRSINEWGVSQDRVLVLTPRALWRVDYDEAWGKVDHHSRVGLEAIVNVRPKEGGPSSRGVGGNHAHPPASGGGFVISLSQRDGRKNPLMPLLSGMRSARRPSSARGAAAAGASSSPSGPSVATRTYYAVGPIGLSTTVVREGMLMAIEAARAVLVAEGSYSLVARWRRRMTTRYRSIRTIYYAAHARAACLCRRGQGSHGKEERK